MIGQTYGNLIVASKHSTDKYGTKFLCRCLCGGEKIAYKHHLQQGRVKSCGCIKMPHGQAKPNSRTRIYRIWVGMKQRCNNKNSNSYDDYGGRGIHVSKEWNQFTNFYNDMGDPPINMSLERIDNNKGYSKDNCKWASMSDQLCNKRETKFYSAGSLTLAPSQWARHFKIPTSTMYGLLQRKNILEIYELFLKGNLPSRPRKAHGNNTKG